MNDLIELDTNIRDCRLAVAKARGEIGRTLAYANAIVVIRNALEPHKEGIMALQSSPLGFLADRVYTWEQVREVMVEGLFRGLSMVGNEINIFGGRLYATKNGCRKLVNSWPGLRNVALHFENPTMPNGESGTALAGGIATWQLDGDEMRLDFTKTDKGDFRIPIKVNRGMGPDAVLGKLERKMLFKIHSLVTGLQFDDSGEDDDEASDPNAIDASATPTNSGALPSPEMTAEEKQALRKAYYDSTVINVKNAENKEALDGLWSRMKQHHPELEDDLKPVFSKRKGELTREAKNEPAHAG